MLRSGKPRYKLPAAAGRHEGQAYLRADAAFGGIIRDVRRNERERERDRVREGAGRDAITSCSTENVDVIYFACLMSFSVNHNSEALFYGNSFARTGQKIRQKERKKERWKEKLRHDLPLAGRVIKVRLSLKVA